MMRMAVWGMYQLAARMVSHVARSLGGVGLHVGMTSYLGRAWWGLELHGCYCMGACVTYFNK